MNKLKKWLRSPAATILGFAVAAGLLLFSTVGGVRAALRTPSDYFGAEVSMRSIGVTLLENGDPVSYRDFNEEGDYENGEFGEGTGVLLENMLGEGEKLQLAKKYPEAIAVENSGEIDQYVRVTLYRYWLKAGSDTEKDPTVSPGLIHIELDNQKEWILDTDSSTAERSVFYYSKKLTQGEKSSALTKSIMIDGSIVTKMREEVDGNTIRHSYDYNGRQFVLYATVDAVQDHHAADAIRSAWGVDGAAKGINITD